MNLLSDQSSNAKLKKNTGIDASYQTSILYLAPADLAIKGRTVCPASTAGCRASCLYSAGRGQMNSVQTARIRKTVLYFTDRAVFVAQLVADLERLVARQKRTGRKQAVRLNGTSDISWELQLAQRDGRAYMGVPQAFPELQFYDYTKRPERALREQVSIDWPSNYHLTFSQSHADQKFDRVDAGFLNIAVVFRGPKLPTEYKGKRVIDGTTHDMRFLDPRGVIVGLLPKGRAKTDVSGFVVDLK